METVLVIVNSAGVFVIAAGLFLTWRRNGKGQKDRDLDMVAKQAARDQAIKGNLDNILERLNDPITGLTAIKEEGQGMKEHCAAVSTALCGRLTATERDIKEIKQKRRPARS